ncbi:hypothetical protein XM38_003660 [Halomicronema hongdechloris C2206]|uniref:Uncharacterized protein n=1 Tax=Halomicronema hongdechloris C2206 TaxID=1641165 RepID=A0A1Z3HGI4_9CYAN|nr:hypothetical protein [Halomicronema hongdechloris]ASC69439.1 hypothetical protein XM38_003660 [Halomicronema hongdechloris C2206]
MPTHDPANPNPQSADTNPEDNVVDPRDLVYKGGYDKEPDKIVNNPAVTPPMPEDTQTSTASFISDTAEDDEAEWLLD